MTAPVGDLVAGIIVLDGLWAIEALSVDLHAGSFIPPGYAPSLPVVEVSVHADDFAAAEKVAARLDLAPEAQDAVQGLAARKLRRYWSGWVTSAPGESLVSARVVAFEPLADHPTPTGPGARDGWESVPLFGDDIATDDESADEPVKATA